MQPRYWQLMTAICSNQFVLAARKLASFEEREMGAKSRLENEFQLELK